MARQTGAEEVIILHGALLIRLGIADTNSTKRIETYRREA
jgi:hypothetical protein